MLFVNRRSSVLPLLWVAQSICWIRKCSRVSSYSDFTISCSSEVAPLLHSPDIQSPCGRLKSPIKMMSGVGEGRDLRNFFSAVRYDLNWVWVDLYSLFLLVWSGDL